MAKEIQIKYPGGMRGIAKTTTREDMQEELFLPCDNILIAVNAAGEIEYGTLVCDLNDDNEIDPDRAARLQSAFRVIKYPDGAANCALAFQLGPSGKKDTQAGYFVDRLTADADNPVNQTTENPNGEQGEAKLDPDGKLAIALGSFLEKGPFHCGTGKCEHKRGKDDDGNPISSLHIDWKALFRKNDTEDGPLKFEGPLSPPTVDLDQRIKVHLSWDQGEKKWYWWTTSPMNTTWVPHTVPHETVPHTVTPTDPTRSYPKVNFWDLPGNTPTNPTTRPNVPTPPTVSTSTGIVPGAVPFGGELPGTESGPGGPFVPTGAGISNSITDTPENPMYLNTSLSPIMSPGMAFRPQNYTPGSIDTGMFNPPTSESSGKASNAPVTAMTSAFGAQGGSMAQSGYPAGQTGAQGDPWVYNEQPLNSEVAGERNSNYLGGTADGGIVFHPAETDLRDVSNGMAPSNTTLSTCYILVAPHAYFGAGVPELVNGSIKDGYSWGVDEDTGDLVFRSHSQSAAPSEAIRFTKTSKNIQWYSGVSFYGEIDHANTANRTYTFPDKSGTVAMTSDVSALGALKTADQTVTSSTTLVDDSALTVTLVAGVKYQFEIFLHLSKAVDAVGGYRFTVDGTATMTTFRAACQVYDHTTSTCIVAEEISSLGSLVTTTPNPGDNYAEIKGAFQVDVGGTFKLQWAQAVSNANGSTIVAGSAMTCTVIA